MIHIVVPGIPVAKGRPRVGKVNGHARLFTPEKTVNYECRVADAGAEVMAGRAPLQGPLELCVEAYFQVQKGASKRRLAIVAAGKDWHTSKPDADNVLKVAGDALNGIVWRDDALVASARIIKLYSTTPRLEITVRELEGD